MCIDIEEGVHGHTLYKSRTLQSDRTFLVPVPAPAASLLQMQAPHAKCLPQMSWPPSLLRALVTSALMCTPTCRYKSNLACYSTVVDNRTEGAHNANSHSKRRCKRWLTFQEGLDHAKPDVCEKLRHSVPIHLGECCEHSFARCSSEVALWQTSTLTAWVWVWV